MGLELYLDLISQPCRSVYLFAKKNNIPFELKHIDLLKGQQRDANFRAVNLLMKVPALKDGDFILTESIAILLYLARKFQTPDHWYPADLQKRAQVDEFLSWQHTGIRIFVFKLYQIKVVQPLCPDTPVPPEVLARATEGLNETLKVFEEKFLQDKPFIAGDEISLADLVALVTLMQASGAGHNVFEGRPKLAAYHNRLVDAVGRDLFLEAHHKILHPETMTLDQLTPGMKEQLAQALLRHIQ